MKITTAAVAALTVLGVLTVTTPVNAAVPTRAEPAGWSDGGTPFVPVPSVPHSVWDNANDGGDWFPDPTFPDPDPFPNPAPKPSSTPSPSQKGPKWINLWQLGAGVGGPAMIVGTPYIMWGCLSSKNTSYALYPLADGSSFSSPLAKGTIVGKSTDCTKSAPYLIRFEPLSVPANRVASNGTFSFRFGTYRPSGGAPRFDGGYSVPMFASVADCTRNGYVC